MRVLAAQLRGGGENAPTINAAQVDFGEAARAIALAFAVMAGCDKSFATCGAKFANRDNFRGFPYMPGNDAVLAGPASDRPDDGGRR
jgi:uncharacterized phage protein (TIGR02218 family)